MARVSPVYMERGDSTPAGYAQTPVAHLLQGGQFGYSKNYRAWMNDHPFTTRPVITLLVEAPLFFKMLPNAQENISMLRSLVETVRTKWTGFQHKKVVNWDSKNFGADGQKYEFYTNVTVEYGQLSMSVWERPGMPIKRYLDFWIDMGLMNEETKYASIATVAGTEAYDALPDMYTMSMLAIEPDVTGRRVNQAWYCFNMAPRDSGDNEAQSDKENPATGRELNIGWTALFHYGYGVDLWAQTILDKLNPIGANVMYEKAFVEGLDAMVAAGQSSYASTIQHIARSRIK